MSGVAAASLGMSFTDYSPKQKSKFLVLGALAGAFPDLDAVSLWSKFDGTIGNWLNLPAGKAIYFGKNWYSHHAFLHSVFAAILFVFLVWLIFRCTDLFEQTKNVKIVLFSLFICYNLHLLEDMPTPACVWGGVRYWFPSGSYAGGWGRIWWWNNYDLFLLIFSCVISNVLLNVVAYWKSISLQKIATGLSMVFVLLFCKQIITRPIDFNYSGHTTRYNEFERASLEIQKEILGDDLYEVMWFLDSKIPLNF